MAQLRPREGIKSLSGKLGGNISMRTDRRTGKIFTYTYRQTSTKPLTAAQIAVREKMCAVRRYVKQVLSAQEGDELYPVLETYRARHALGEGATVYALLYHEAWKNGF